MGIMAVMMLLSASAFLTIRDQYTVDQTAEELLTRIREAQNKAISISKDSAGNETKIWVLSVSNNNFDLVSFYDQGSNLLSFIEKDDLNPQSTNISAFEVTGTAEAPISGSSYVAFAAPFAKTYLLADDSCTGNDGGCEWVRSTRPTEEWEITSDQQALLDETQSLKYVVQKGVHTTAVIIKANGDSYIE
jgi:hypothetical protein